MFLFNMTVFRSRIQASIRQGDLLFVFLSGLFLLFCLQAERRPFFWGAGMATRNATWPRSNAPVVARQCSHWTLQFATDAD